MIDPVLREQLLPYLSNAVFDADTLSKRLQSMAELMHRARLNPSDARRVDDLSLDMDRAARSLSRILDSLKRS